MAFNPFNIFRRNQRMIFAVITVFVMFTFVLSSGLAGNADFFSWLPNWIGSKTNRGAPLFELDGRKYYQQDLVQLRLQRIAANQYMSFAAGATIESLRSSISSSLGKVSKDNQQQLMQIYSEVHRTASAPVSFAQARPALRQAQARAREIASRPEAPRLDIEVARDIENYAAFVEHRLSTMSPSQDTYFSIPYRTDRDLVEFLLWLKKADQLGINFNEKEVQGLVRAEFLGKLPGHDEVEIRRRVVADRRITNTRLWEALNDEFRVRLAENSVLGSDVQRPGGTLSSLPAYATPFDLFTTYQDDFSPTNYKMLLVPVANYLNDVKETPTTAELEKLFNEYKNVEPNPASEKPGFKEPRKAKLEWIAANPGDAYYRSRAEEWYQQSAPHAQVGVLFQPMANIITLSASLVPLTIPDLANHKRYLDKVQSHYSDVQQQYVSGRSLSSIVLESHRNFSGNLASAIGALLGSSPLGGSVALPSAGAAFELNAWARERQARLQVGLPLILGAIVPYAWYGPAVVQAYESFQSLPKPSPPAYYANEFRQQTLNDLAYTFFNQDLEKFRQEIVSRTKDIRDAAKKKQAVEGYISEFVRTRGLKHGGTTEFRDEFTVADDPGMAALKSEASREPQRGPLPPVFGRSFFYIPATESQEFRELQQQLMFLRFFAQQAQGDPQQLAQIEGQMMQLLPRLQRLLQQPDIPVTGLYDPRFYPENPGVFAPAEPKPVFLVWRTEEQAPRTVTFRVAEPKVLAAWKCIKARDLAQREADRIAEEIRSKKPSTRDQLDQLLRDAEAQLQAKSHTDLEREGIRLFSFTNVAPFLESPSEMDAMATGAASFRITPTPNIPYPSDEMREKLLAERKQPTGTTFVLTDAPKDRFYVTSVEMRIEKTESEFKQHVYNAPRGTPLQQFVRDRHAQKIMKTQSEGVLALLKKQFNYQNENAEALDRGTGD